VFIGGDLGILVAYLANIVASYSGYILLGV